MTMATVCTSEKKRQNQGRSLWSDMRRWKGMPERYESGLRFVAVAMIQTMRAVAIHSLRRPLWVKALVSARECARMTGAAEV